MGVRHKRINWGQLGFHSGELPPKVAPRWSSLPGKFYMRGTRQEERIDKQRWTAGAFGVCRPAMLASDEPLVVGELGGTSPLLIVYFERTLNSKGEPNGSPFSFGGDGWN